MGWRPRQHKNPRIALNQLRSELRLPVRLLLKKVHAQNAGQHIATAQNAGWLGVPRSDRILRRYEVVIEPVRDYSAEQIDHDYTFIMLRQH